jgi:hypothetical protein
MKSTVKPCANSIDSVQPSGELASSSSARRRSSLGRGRRHMASIISGLDATARVSVATVFRSTLKMPVAIPSRITTARLIQMLVHMCQPERGQPGGVPLAKANPAEQGDAGGVRWIVGVAEAHSSRTLPA